MWIQSLGREDPSELTPVLPPRKSHGQRSPATGLQRVGHDLVVKQQSH